MGQDQGARWPAAGYCSRTERDIIGLVEIEVVRIVIWGPFSEGKVDRGD